MRRRVSLLAAVILAACATTAVEPPVPAGIVITPIETGRLFGGRAVYGVDAPLALVRRELLDFGAHAGYRPMVLEAKTISTREDGGAVFFRLHGAMGVEPEANCEYTVIEEDDTVRIDFRMTNPSFALWALEGSFHLLSVKNGAGTRIDQQFLVSALSVDRRQLLQDLRADCDAIRAHLQAVAAR